MQRGNASDSGDRTVRIEAFDLAIAGLFIVALLIRAALYFPLAAFPADSDSVFGGLCALHVLDGHHPIFMPGQDARHGAATCYVTAAIFALVGPSRVGVALSALLFEALYLFCVALFLREVLPRAQACLAFLFAAIPPAQVLAVTYQPYSYTATMAGCAVALFFAACWRKKANFWNALMFGLAIGVGFWVNPISLMITLPAVLWIAWGRGFALIREAWPALVGFMIGALPWFVFNLLFGFPSLHSKFVQPVPGLGDVGQNLAYFLFTNLAMLLTGAPAPQGGAVGMIILAAYLMIAAGLLVAAAKGSHSSQDPHAETVRSLVGLGLLVFCFVLVMNVFSQSGSIRGWTVRYILPLYVVIPPLMALGLAELGKVRRWLPAIPIVAIVGLNLMLYSLPGTAARAALTAELEQHKRLQAILSETQVQALFGDYWLVYHLNFDSQRRIFGIPMPGPDYYNFTGNLPARGLKWALIGPNAADLRRRADRVGASGRTVELDALKIFLPDQASTQETEALIEALSAPAAR